MANLCLWPPLRLRRRTVGEGQRHVPFSNFQVRTFCIETFGHSPNKFAIRLSRSDLDLFPSGVGISKGDVRSDGAGKQNGILGHKSNNLSP